MSQEQTTTVTCDECGTTAEMPSGWHPKGWFNLKRGYHTNDPFKADINFEGDVDLCGTVCLSQWALARIPKAKAS